MSLFPTSRRETLCSHCKARWYNAEVLLPDWYHGQNTALQITMLAFLNTIIHNILIYVAHQHIHITLVDLWSTHKFFLDFRHGVINWILTACPTNLQMWCVCAKIVKKNSIPMFAVIFYFLQMAISDIFDGKTSGPTPRCSRSVTYPASKHSWLQLSFAGLVTWYEWAMTECQRSSSTVSWKMVHELMVVRERDIKTRSRPTLKDAVLCQWTSKHW